jgi:hypothetical protein
MDKEYSFNALFSKNTDPEMMSRIKVPFRRERSLELSRQYYKFDYNYYFNITNKVAHKPKPIQELSWYSWF